MRLFLILFMIAIPIYLSFVKPEFRAEINLSSTYLKFILNYFNPVGKEIELLEKQSIRTRFLIAKGFKSIEITSKITNEGGKQQYKIDSENDDKIDLEFNAFRNFFYINSLKFKGITQLELSSGEIANSIQLKSVEGSSDRWNVYADIILPDTFNVRTEALKSNSDSQKVVNDDLQIYSPGNNGFQKIVLQNNADILALDFDKEIKLNLKDLDIIDFQTMRYDYFENKDISALNAGNYSIFGLNNTIRDTIVNHDEIRFEAERLILRELKIEDKAITAKIDGRFSSFQIGRIDDYDEQLPSMLLNIIKSKFGYFYLFIYVLLFILTLFWQNIFSKSFTKSSHYYEKRLGADHE